MTMGLKVFGYLTVKYYLCLETINDLRFPNVGVN